jgi:hypothetical protein
MTPRIVIVELARIEAVHLAGLVAQFADLLTDTELAASDPAVARLVPDAYSDDAAAAQEFRSLTEDDLLDRRRDDAHVVLASLGAVASLPDDASQAELTEAVTVQLDASTVQSWLRTLAAIRLVMASRLGIDAHDDHDPDDDRFGIYDWVGYRLDALVGALDD